MSIVLEHLTKRYAGHPVVNGVSLQAGDGELYVLLGPSGSGKSTLLRMIAGLADVDAGRVLLHGRDVTELPPARRGVGFVFQSYALFRGMTAAENVEFALRIRGVKAGERRRRRDELLEMVGLTGLGGRHPRQLSGGQQQRVALARALAHQPEVLLLDEPFGALDARVRLELRRTVRAIQRELRITTLFVTHDQEEAFELADRVAVMNFGRLLEEGPPDELYLRPATEFVATFLGTANLMVAEPPEDAVAEEDARQPADLVVVGRPARDGVELAERLLSGGAHNLLLALAAPVQAIERVLICVAIGEPGKADVSFAGRLARHLGAEVTILTVLPEAEQGRPTAGADRFLASCARTLARQGVAASTRIRFGAPREQILLERAEGRHDLLVVGAPLPRAGGHIDLGGLMARLVRESEVPVLIVRSPEAAA